MARTGSGTLKVTTPSETEIAMTRVLDAPRNVVWEALVRPELVRKWLLGPPGWSMPVCEVDMRVGGKYRYVWKKDDDGTEMGVGGVFTQVVPGERFAGTEKFDQAWYPGEATTMTVLTESAGKTTLTLTVKYATREARDMMVTHGMTGGVEMSYDRLAELLQGLAA